MVFSLSVGCGFQSGGLFGQFGNGVPVFFGDKLRGGEPRTAGAADGTFSSTANLTKAYLYGSYYYHNSAPNITNDSDLIKGNTLNVNAQGISVYGIRNFEKYNFNLTDKNTSGGTLLTTSDGFGMTVKWDNIQLNADKLKTYVGWVNGKNYFTLLHSNTANALKFSEYAERTGTDGDYEYAVRAEGTTTDGIRSATNVTADYNRYQNAKTVYSGEAASDGNIYGGYSSQGRTTTNNELTVKALSSGNLNNVYGAMTDTTTATAHSTYNTVNIESTVGTTRTIGNVYGGYTKATTGDATHNTVNLRGGHITGDVYGGKADGTGVTTNNTVNIEGTGITVGGALSLAVACPLEVPLVVSPEYRMLRAIKTSTRRFWARPSSVSFDAIGRYSLYPSALKRAGFNVGCAGIRPRIRLTARAELSSQFEGNCAVEIGTLSVCPEIVTRSGSDERSAAMTGTICSAWPCSCAEPEAKSALSFRRIIKPSSLSSVLT